MRGEKPKKTIVQKPQCKRARRMHAPPHNPSPTAKELRALGICRVSARFGTVYVVGWQELSSRERRLLRTLHH